MPAKARPGLSNDGAARTVIADKTIANAMKNGISEHYDSVSGKALGVMDYCMSSTLVTMMLDGLTQKHHFKRVASEPISD